MVSEICRNSGLMYDIMLLKWVLDTCIALSKA